jgi:hypothetical protein
MSDTGVTIRIKSDADTRGFVEAQAKIAALEGKTKELTTALDKAGKASSSIGQGFGIGIGGQVLTSIQQIPAALSAAVMEGVRFNATLESSKLGIAAVLKQFDETGRFANFKDALAASGDAIDLLKEKAKVSPATFEQLVQGFQGLSGAYASAGLKMKQQVDLTVMMSQALAGLGIRSDQLLQESRALVTGNINEDAAAAKILGITKAQVDSARESGQLFEFLTGKLSAFSEAGAVGAQSFDTQLSNIEDALQQLKGVATEEFFNQIKDGLSGINGALSDEKAEQWAAGLGAGLAQIPEMLKGVMDAAGKLDASLPGGEGFWSLKNTAAYKNWAGVFQPAADAKRADQLDKEKLGLSKGLHEATDETSQTKAVADLEKAIAERRVQANEASGEELAQLNNHVGVLEKMLSRREAIFQKTKEAVALGIMGSDEARPTTIPGLVPNKEDVKAAVEASKRGDRDRKLADDIEEAARGDMGPRERASRLERQTEEAKGGLAADLFDKEGKIIPTGKDFDAAAAGAAIKNIADPERAADYEEKLRGILTLEKDLAKARKDAGDEQAKNQEMLTSAQEELAIQKETTAGHEGAAKALTIERNLRKELAEIAKSDLAPAEKERAADLAKQTAELEKQKAAADQLKKDEKERAEIADKIASAEADNAVAAASQGHSKRALREAKLKQFEVKKREELKDLPADEIDRLTGEAVATEEKRLRKEGHVIGGTARNVSPGSDWNERFVGGRWGVTMGGGPLDAPGLGSTDDSWSRRFHGGAAEAMPDRAPGAAPLPASGKPNVAGNGEGIDGASGKLAKAGDAAATSSGKIDAAAGKIDAAAAQLASAAERFAAAAEKINAFETRISAVEATVTNQ